MLPPLMLQGSSRSLPLVLTTGLACCAGFALAWVGSARAAVGPGASEVVTGPVDPGDVVLLVVFITLALVVSFLCSILEAALLSVGIAELEERKVDEPAAASLLELKRERVDDAISAILILNTIAHTAGVAGAGMQAAKVLRDPVLLGIVFPIVLTLLILVGTEIIPKTLGAVYASKLVGFVSRALRLMVWLLTPLLVLTRGITGALTHGEQKGVSRGELAAMVALARQEGELADHHSRMLSNALRIHEIRLEDVMTPRTVVTMLPAEGDLASFLEDDEHRPFSRLPLYREGDRDQVVGYVLQREILSAVAHGVDTSTPLERYLREAPFLPETTPVDRAMRSLSQQREHLALVTDEYGGISGLITLEDLLETLLGVEILDESDRVADLRAEAVKLREKRLRERGIAIDLATPRLGPGSEESETPAESPTKPSES